MGSVESRSWRQRLRWPVPVGLIVVAAVCLPLGEVFDITALSLVGLGWRRCRRRTLKWFADELRAALKTAEITDYARPFHDLRHSSLTNGAAAGEQPIALMARAGHSSMATTKGYLHLAGVVFRDETDALERRLLTSAY